MDWHGDYHTDWSKSDREIQISYDIAHMWNLKKWYERTYLQNRNKVTDVENKLKNAKREKGRWEELGDWDSHVHTIDTICKIDN